MIKNSKKVRKFLYISLFLFFMFSFLMIGDWGQENVDILYLKGIGTFLIISWVIIMLLRHRQKFNKKWVSLIILFVFLYPIGVFTSPQKAYPISLSGVIYSLVITIIISVFLGWLIVFTTRKQRR